ncbi:hypothetical protein [Methylogaea oryzae]|uniref:Uncharacterized protein n=2 Tax=Methylogaea oryzae TaxID=1295382 RepID=A0A8D4VRR4_9GAMM|nr:hypothetical protein [Methylogaea oryzae]BBL72517.1 hypothetical protein MoryE10_31230 [Methylogaea oryzae]
MNPMPHVIDRGRKAMFASLRILRPEDRLIYLNGDYQNPAGNSSTDTFTVAAGGHTAETLDSQGKVDFRKKFRVTARQTSVAIELDPVVPPESV